MKQILYTTHIPQWLLSTSCWYQGHCEWCRTHWLMTQTIPAERLIQTHTIIMGNGMMIVSLVIINPNHPLLTWCHTRKWLGKEGHCGLSDLGYTCLAVKTMILTIDTSWHANIIQYWLTGIQWPDGILYHSAYSLPPLYIIIGQWHLIYSEWHSLL